MVCMFSRDGNVHDCTCSWTGNCTYDAVDEVNAKAVFPILRELVKTPFFRYFKVGVDL